MLPYTLSHHSSSKILLHLPRTRTVYGARALSIAAPTVWNKLQFGTNFLLMFSFQTVSLVLNQALKLFYFELSIIVRPCLCIPYRTLWRYINVFYITLQYIIRRYSVSSSSKLSQTNCCRPANQI